MIVLPWQGRLAVIGVPTANPLSAMETFERIDGGQFRRSGPRADVADGVEFREERGVIKMWRKDQFWVRVR